MRRFGILAAILLPGSAGAPQVVPDEPYWTPDAAMIAKLEAGLKILQRPQLTTDQLQRYDRYYTGVTLNSRRAWK
jgi:hypothetical protein